MEDLVPGATQGGGVAVAAVQEDPALAALRLKACIKKRAQRKRIADIAAEGKAKAAAAAAAEASAAGVQIPVDASSVIKKYNRNIKRQCRAKKKLAGDILVGSTNYAEQKATTHSVASGATSDDSGNDVAKAIWSAAEKSILNAYWASGQRTNRAKHAQKLIEENMIQTVSAVSTEIHGVRGPWPEHVVGQYKKGILVFPPPTLDVGLRKVDALVLNVFEVVADYLESEWLEVYKTFGDEQLQEGESHFLGARIIAGNRFQFFIKTDEKKSACFLNVIKEAHQWHRNIKVDDMEDSSPGTKQPHSWYSNRLLNDIEASCVSEEIVNYAIRQAKTIPALYTGFDMGNFAYIVSIGQVAKQDVHIDLGNEKHHQLSVLCSKDCSMTSEYMAEGRSLQPGENLSAVWDDITPELAEMLSETVNVQPLLDKYGHLLCHTGELVQANSAKDVDLPIGTLLCLPGAVPHCGPAVDGTETSVRAILFFTATPEEDDEYDPEIQYSRSSLISDIMRNSWTKMDQKEREYMLNRWYDDGLVHDSYTFANLRHAPLRDMAETLSIKCNPSARKKYIKAMAAKKEWNKIEVWDAVENYDPE